MADVIRKATNKFSKGLIMDFSPENTGNEVLTHALNATFLTFNGNEMSLQNDMGNGRVETAFLPEGYIPVGTCEFGGIIYIVSYNPLEDKSQIGCFPSPERNVSSDELGELKAKLSLDAFQEYTYDYKNTPLFPTGKINNNSKYILLKNDNLNPGDKFIIYADENIYKERISDLYTNNQICINPLIKINVVSIEDSGKIIYLTDTLRQYQNNNYKYHILGQNKLEESEGNFIDIDSYRNMLSSGYNIFKSKTSGKLAILAELIMIDSYSVTHEIKSTNDSQEEYEIIIHTEVSPEIKTKVITSNIPKTRGIAPPSEDIGLINNHDEIPKLKYYYLEQSNLKNNNIEYNIDHEFKKNEIFNINDESKLNVEFNLPKSNTYHLNMILDETDYDKNIPDNVYSKFEENYYYRVKSSQFLINLEYFKNLHVKIYEYNDFLEKFVECSDNMINDNSIYFFKFPKTTYIPGNKFVPNKNINWMWNSQNASPYESIGEKRLYLYKNDGYIINKNSIKYPSVKLGNVKIPKDINNLPITYNYTLIPCMEYGKLDHLKIKNSIDFSKINNFSYSDFNIWKYRVDGNQLRLTFGAEIYDSFSTEKVKGLFLEFYDHRGFAGSLNISGKQSYSGVFNKIIQLNSLNSLDSFKINPDNNSELIEGVCRNYNIRKNGENYTYNGKPIKQNELGQWYYDISSNFETEIPDQGAVTRNSNTISILVENDLGVLYSNSLYIVKAYFKIENNDSITYEKKQDYILYTLPIYNEYYYNKPNYSVLKYPELELMLTYKLIDESSRSSYSNKNYTDGYNSEDYNNISKYISGKYENIDLSATKYYLNKGTTQLFLEIGLKEDYSKINILSDPELNKKFKCKLQLISDSDSNNTFEIESTDQELSDKNNCKLGFGDNFSKTQVISSNFNNYNFMSTTDNSIPINIKYEFVTGYKFTIFDIRDTQIPTTTICALCHKQINGEYNYSDFGVYEYDNDNDSNTDPIYYSDNFFYNTGDSTRGYLGICKLVRTYGKSSDIKIVNKEYSDDPYNTHYNKFHLSIAKNFFDQIGKLTFCVPHGHIHSKYYGTNLYGYNNEYYIGRSNDNNKDFEQNNIVDNTDGTAPTTEMYDTPMFSLCPITTDLLVTNSRFISAIQSHEVSENIGCEIKYWNIESNTSFTSQVGYLVRFRKFTPDDLCKFNKKMIETMKNIYAYNPDYNYINMRIGEVNLQEHETKFISNLICIDSELNIDNLNNYIYMNGFKYSEYLNDLLSITKLDNNDFIKNQISFKPNLKYCGTKTVPYLITKLNYNIPVPKTLSDELSFKESQIIIKKSDGTNILFSEIPRKNLLYYYDEDNNKLVQLDVSNYEIDKTTGILSLKSNYINSYKDKSNLIIYIPTPTSDYYIRDWHHYSIKDTYKSACLAESSITINDLMYDYQSEHRLYLKQSNYFLQEGGNTARLYYRKTIWKNNDSEIDNTRASDDWSQNNIDKNYTQLYYGPSYYK